jgi:hypothetical protein
MENPERSEFTSGYRIEFIEDDLLSLRIGFWAASLVLNDEEIHGDSSDLNRLMLAEEARDTSERLATSPSVYVLDTGIPEDYDLLKILEKVVDKKEEFSSLLFTTGAEQTSIPEEFKQMDKMQLGEKFDKLEAMLEYLIDMDIMKPAME